MYVCDVAFNLSMHLYFPVTMYCGFGYNDIWRYCTD